jgi:hypothetical protein
MKDRTHPVLTFTTVRELEAYLSGELADSSGFWLKLSKIGAPEPTISKAEAIEAALCCGWIDGQLGGLDDHYFLVRMPPPPGRAVDGRRTTARPRSGLHSMAGSGLPALRRSKGRKLTGDGLPPMGRKERRKSRRIWKRPWRWTTPRTASSRRWIAPIALRSSTG